MRFRLVTTVLALFFLTSVTGAQAANAASNPFIELKFPLDCKKSRNCRIAYYYDHKGKDYLCGHRAKPSHDGTDFGFFTEEEINAGIPVLASAPGEVYRIGADESCGTGVAISHANGWSTQYCHLKKGSLRVKKGDSVKAGQPLGLVGKTGLSDFYHLHMTLAFKNKPVDPFAFGRKSAGCYSGPPLFRPSILYKRHMVVAAGFTDKSDDYDFKDILATGKLPKPDRTKLLISYIYLLGMERGDRIETTITGPGGYEITHLSKPLRENKPAFAHFFGDGKKPKNKRSGRFRVRFEIYNNDNNLVLEHSAEIVFVR